MTSVENIRHLTTLTFNILRYGSTTERVVLGTALLGAGLIAAQKLYNLAAYLFSKRQPSVALPKFEVNKEVIAAQERAFQLRHSISAPPPPAPIVPNAQEDAAAVQPHSLLANLSINNIALTEATQPRLAEALYAYDELRTLINGEENRFVFLTESYLGSPNLPATLKWEEKGIELTIPAHFNQLFQGLSEKLRQVGLGLENVKPSGMPIAKAVFISGPPKEIFSLAELYQTVKLQGPHILSPLEISLKKEKIKEAKHKLHESRLSIIQRTLSTFRALFLDDLIITFPEKHKELYTLFGSPGTLRFVVENTCWHALDRALESIEVTFIPSKEMQQNIRKIDLEGNLVKILAEKAKQEQAQAFLFQILTDPNDDKAIKSLVDLLLGEGASPERDAFVRKLQQPKLEIEERFIHQELSRLDSIQQFYHALAVATAVADEGKNALRAASQEVAKLETITSKPIPVVSDEMSRSVLFVTNTYGKEVENVSAKVVEAAEKGVITVSGQKWQTALASLDEELGKISDLSPVMRDEIVRLGWVTFDNKSRLIHLTGSQRWLLTKKMIITKIVRDSLQGKGTQLVQEVGKGAASFIKTLYGRLVTVLLAFDARTEGAAESDPKPADRVAKTLFDSLLQSYQALLKVKKDAKYAKQNGQREKGVVKVLENQGDIHPSASNKASADAVFLGKFILELFSILQPEGLSADIKKALLSALRQGGSVEPTIIRRAIEMYNSSIQPAVQPWVGPVGKFLLQALENIIERQSASGVASQMTEVLNPININAALIDLLKGDQSKIEITPPIGQKETLKWYQEDEDNICTQLAERVRKITDIDLLEKRLQEIEKAKGDNRTLLADLLPKKKELAQLDMQLLPELLRRILLANVPLSFAGYVLQFAYDLFELIQYPRILRHIVFNVMEKAVQTLPPLEKKETEDFLNGTAAPVARQPLIDFIFSQRQKMHIGNTIAELFWSMSPTDNAWSVWGFVAQASVKTLPVGSTIFSAIQHTVENLIKEKFKDPEAIKWSGAKLIGWMDERILKFADDATDKGMTALIEAQLSKALEVKKI